MIFNFLSSFRGEVKNRSQSFILMRDKKSDNIGPWNIDQHLTSSKVDSFHVKNESEHEQISIKRQNAVKKMGSFFPTKLYSLLYKKVSQTLSLLASRNWTRV